MNRYFCCALLLLMLMAGGCATPSEQILKLRTENKQLGQLLANREQKIEALTEKRDYLQTELDYFTKRSNVLKEEKQIRIQESQGVRKGARRFTDEMIRALQEASEGIDVVDYVGSEILRRGLRGREKNCLLVDLDHRLLSSGTLVGGRAYLAGPSTIQFCLLRPTEQGRELTVVWMSQAAVAKKAGSMQWTFSVPAVVQKGDLIGVYSQGTNLIPYDDVDTGNVMMVKGKVKLNSTVPFKYPEGRDGCAYSFGCVGYLGAE